MSAVTAVPLRPLAKGSVLRLWLVLALLVALAAGLAWWSTRWMQVVTLDSGTRYQVLAPGTGPAFGSQDVAAIHLRLHLNRLDAPVIRDTTQDEDGPDPVVTTFNSLPPGLHAAAANFRTGGRYLLWVPASVYVGGPIPPNAPFTGGDTLVLEVRVLQVVPGQAMAFETRRVQQMMQRQQMMEQLQRQQGGNSAAPAAPPAGNGAAPAGGR
jgi:FKBP-type peptidyl-prolyl cis-trans isomerase FkpA